MGEKRLPTLFEVLNRFSAPPVDLWSFYVFMSEQYGGIEYLNFWLDCAAHRALCRDYGKLKQQRIRSSLNRSSLQQPPDRDGAEVAANRASTSVNVTGTSAGNDGGSPSSSALFDMLMDDVLDSSSEHYDEEGDLANHPPIDRGRHSNHNSSGSNSTQIPKVAAETPQQPTQGIKQSQANNKESPHSGSTLSRKDIRESAQKIISTYLSPGAGQELVLPKTPSGWPMAASIRNAAEGPGGLDNPQLFDDGMTYVFEVLEREAYPAFLSQRALSNVQPVSAALRLFGGLLGLFAGFWLSFVFILLNWRPKYERCWVILPFGLGWYFTISSLWHLDPILAAVGLGERDGGGVWRLKDEYVRYILLRRSIIIALATALLTAACCVLFIFVPGHRLLA